MSVLEKHFTRAKPRTFVIEVTGYDLKSDPPIVMGRDIHAVAGSPEIKVELCPPKQAHERRRDIKAIASKVKAGGLLRIDGATPKSANHYVANWIVQIATEKGHGLALKGKARVVPRSWKDLSKGMQVEMLSSSPPTRVKTRDELIAAIKSALADGNGDKLQGSTPFALLRVMDAANPAADADVFTVYLAAPDKENPNETQDARIERSLATSKALDIFLNKTQNALEYSDALLIEVARGHQYMVGKDSLEGFLRRNQRFWIEGTYKDPSGATHPTYRTAGFTDAILGLRRLAPRPDLGYDSEMVVAINLATPEASAKFTPTGRDDHAQKAAPSFSETRDGDDAAAVSSDAGADDLPPLDDDFDLAQIADQDYDESGPVMG